MEASVMNCSKVEMDCCDRVAEAAKAFGNIVRDVPKLSASSTAAIA